MSSYDNFNNSHNSLVKLISGILEKGELTQQDKDNLDKLKGNYNNSYKNVKSDLQDAQDKKNEKQIIENSSKNSHFTQEEIFNFLTNNGETQGIFIDEETKELYINAEFIQTKGWKIVDDEGNTILEIDSDTGKLKLSGKLSVTGTFGKVLIDDGNMTLTDKLARIVGNISGTGIGFKYLGTADTQLKNPNIVLDMEDGTFQCINFSKISFNGMTYGGDDWENLVLSSGVAENYSYPSRVRGIAGQTEIQLSVKGITTFPKTICNLPTKYRPSRSLFFLGTYGETNPVTVKFKVTSDGDVIAIGSTNTSPSDAIGYFLNCTFSRA